MEIIAKKTLGQHFLNSKSVINKIIEAGKIDPTDTILEIGPGTGILTKALLETQAKVIAVEKDRRAVELLREKFNKEIKEQRLDLTEGDILEENNEYLPKNYKLIANIPYYITGAIFRKFLETENQPNKMVLLVQKEVADRIVSKNKKESVLSLSVKVFGKPSIITKVPKGAFNPPPKVDSAVLLIDQISNELLKNNNLDAKSFFEIVNAGFAHKRKFAKNNLAEIYTKEKMNRVWKENNFEEKIRAEDFSLEKWLKIAISIK